MVPGPHCLPREIEVDVLHARVLFERVQREVLPKSRLLEPAVWHLADEHAVLVDPDRPEVELVRDLHARDDIPSIDRSREPIVDIICVLYRLVQGAIVIDAYHGPEDLLPAHPHLLRRISQDRGLEEEALLHAPRSPSSDGDPGPLLFSYPDVLFDPPSLRLGDERSHVRRLVQRIAYPEVPGLLGHPLDELLVDPFVGDDARHGRAVLAGVPEAS